jgi:hypothetical protein
MVHAVTCMGKSEMTKRCEIAIRIGCPCYWDVSGGGRGGLVVQWLVRPGDQTGAAAVGVPPSTKSWVDVVTSIHPSGWCCLAIDQLCR